MPSFSCASLSNLTRDRFTIQEVLQRDSGPNEFVNTSIHIACTDDFINDIINGLPNQSEEYSPESISGQWFIATTMIPDSFFPEVIAIKRNKTNYPYGDYDLLNVKLIPSTYFLEYDWQNYAPVLDNSILWDKPDSKYLKNNGNKISMLVSPEKIVMEMSGLVGFNDLEWNKDHYLVFFDNIDTMEKINATVSRKKINTINNYSFITPIWGKINIPCMTWFGDLYMGDSKTPYLYLAKFPDKTENNSNYYGIPLVNKINENYFNWGIFCGLEWYDSDEDKSEILEFITFPSKTDQFGISVNEVKPSFIRENNHDKNFGHPDDVPYGRYFYYDWEHETFIPSIYIDVYPAEN